MGPKRQTQSFWMWCMWLIAAFMVIIGITAFIGWKNLGWHSTVGLVGFQLAFAGAVNLVFNPVFGWRFDINKEGVNWLLLPGIIAGVYLCIFTYGALSYGPDGCLIIAFLMIGLPAAMLAGILYIGVLNERAKKKAEGKTAEV